MKQTKKTLMVLNARYRAVLLACILAINATGQAANASTYDYTIGSTTYHNLLVFQGMAAGDEFDNIGARSFDLSYDAQLRKDYDDRTISVKTSHAF